MGRERPITAHDLVNIRDIGGHELSAINVFGALSASPDGHYVAFQMQTPSVESRKYNLSWHVIETRQQGRKWKVDDGGDLILNPDKSWFINGSRYPLRAQWSPDSAWIYYLKKDDESIQLWRSKRDGSVTEQLTHSDADLLSFSISGNGNEISFTTAIPAVELSTRLAEEAARGYLYDDRFHPSKARKPLARVCGVDGDGEAWAVGIERACEPPPWIYDLTARTERKATHEDRSQIANTTSFWLLDNDRYTIAQRDDGSRIMLVNEDPEKFTGFAPPLRLFVTLNGETIRCDASQCYGFKRIIENAWWRSGWNEVIFLRTDGYGSMSGLYSWTPVTGEVRTIIKTEDQLADCQVLQDRAICLREQWTHPRTIASIDLERGTIETVYDPNPDFSRIKFSKIEKIEWEDVFDNPTHGHLVYPLNYERGQRYPLIITTYRSRGFLRGAIGDEYPIHVLAANGFMVLSHDMPWPLRRYAAVSDTGRAQFEDNYERRSSLSAQEKVLDILDERGLIDPERVGITGLSNGAMQVVFALTHTNRFAAAIASSAFDYTAYYYSSNQQKRAKLRHAFGSSPHEDKNGLYRALSLGLNVERVNAPLLVNISDRELHNSVKSFARLQDAGKTVEMYVYPGEYHIKWQPQHRLAIYRRNVQWLKFWLMNTDEDEPVSPGQYVRWHKMRDQQCRGLDGDDAPGYCENGEVDVAAQ